MNRTLQNLVAAAGALALAACSALGTGVHDETVYIVEATAAG